MKSHSIGVHSYLSEYTDKVLFRELSEDNAGERRVRLNDYVLEAFAGPGYSHFDSCSLYMEHCGTVRCWSHSSAIP